MFLTTATRNPAGRLLHWLQDRWRAEQWLVERDSIRTGQCHGWQKRVLLSRGLCLYYHLDLTKVPASRRGPALQQQVKLLSPFETAGHYAQWQGGKARLWLWNQAELETRLPDAAHLPVLPDSALAGPGQQGECRLAGINGHELQHWQEGELLDSRWLPDPHSSAIELPLSKAAPLQAQDRLLLGHLGLAVVALLLLAAVLLQAGGAVSLWQQQQQLALQLEQQSEAGLVQQHAMRRALQAREQWQQRQALLEQPGQLAYLQQLAATLPEQAGFWQRYSVEPGRLQLQLRDPSPDPRDYVRIVSKLPETRNVQVQLNPNHQLVTLQAETGTGK